MASLGEYIEYQKTLPLIKPSLWLSYLIETPDGPPSMIETGAGAGSGAGDGAGDGDGQGQAGTVGHAGTDGQAGQLASASAIESARAKVLIVHTAAMMMKK